MLFYVRYGTVISDAVCDAHGVSFFAVADYTVYVTVNFAPFNV